MSQEFINNHSEIPWKDMIDFRNIVVHEYFRVNTKIFWMVVERELPSLKDSVKSILEKI